MFNATNSSDITSKSKNSRKRPVSEHFWTINKLKGPKGCFNLYGSTFVIFFHQFGGKSTRKFLVVSEILKLFLNILTPDDKYSLSVKERVLHNQFKCNYFQIKKSILNFLLIFRNLNKSCNTLKNKMSLRGFLFLKL